MTPQTEIAGKILNIRKELGGSLLILAHHYQRPEVVAISDSRGDSLGLSRQAAASSAKYILFCGVRFMAESAAVLARRGQVVLHPEPLSGCPMSDMADPEDVERAFGELDSMFGPRGWIPITYVNSSAEVKALTGARGGSCCTSSNAAKILKWAFGTGRKVVFLPDENLGENTARAMGVPASSMAVWDFSLPLGGNADHALREAEIILWKGYCHVHTLFSRQHVEEARRRFPAAKIVVHPECRREVVESSDLSGSTELMVNLVNGAPAGSAFVIGTELNLVRRLAAAHPDKTIVELSRSMCPNMFKITLNKVQNVLEHLDAAPPVVVDEGVKADARKALELMLGLS